jgi:hypothetical protein
VSDSVATKADLPTVDELAGLGEALSIVQNEDDDA